MWTGSLRMTGDFASAMVTVIPVTLLIGVVELRALISTIRKSHDEIADSVAATSVRVVEAWKADEQPSSWDLSVANRRRWPRKNHLIGMTMWWLWLVTASVNIFAEVQLIPLAGIQEIGGVAPPGNLRADLATAPLCAAGTRSAGQALEPTTSTTPGRTECRPRPGDPLPAAAGSRSADPVNRARHRSPGAVIWITVAICHGNVGSPVLTVQARGRRHAGPPDHELRSPSSCVFSLPERAASSVAVSSPCSSPSATTWPLCPAALAAPPHSKRSARTSSPPTLSTVTNCSPRYGRPRPTRSSTCSPPSPPTSTRATSPGTSRSPTGCVRRAPAT